MLNLASTSRSAAVRVHVYNASNFLMYTHCSHLQLRRLAGDGHSIDYFFVHAVLDLVSRSRRKMAVATNDGHSVSDSLHGGGSGKASPRRSVGAATVKVVAPENADLFVLPVMCSQSAQGKCRGCRHREHVRQLHQWLNASTWYQRRGGADHLIVCDKYSSVGEVRRALPRVIIGRYEHLGGWSKHASAHLRTRTISVGYATTAGTVCAPTASPIPLSSRRYDVLSIMGTKPRPYGQPGVRDAYARRRTLWCDWLGVTPPSARPAKVLVDSPDKGRHVCHANASATWMAGQAEGDAHSLPCRVHHQDFAASQLCDGLALQRDSQAVVSFSGDTPTTIRIFNAFATESVIFAPDEELPMLLRILPFRSVVPWHKIIQPIPTATFDPAPVQTLAALASNTTLLERERIVALMRRYREDVLFDVPESRAYLHLLREAAAFDVS